jgi:hypothetical protein
MTDKIQILMAAALAALGLNTLIPAPAFATDGAHPALLGAAIGPNGYPVAPRLEPRLAPARVQIADSVQSTNSASSSARRPHRHRAGQRDRRQAGAHGGSQRACQGQRRRGQRPRPEGGGRRGCSAKAESSATVKPQKQQSEQNAEPRGLGWRCTRDSEQCNDMAEPAALPARRDGRRPAAALAAADRGAPR